MAPGLTLTGNLENVAGGAVENGTVVLQLCGFGSQIPRVPNTNLLGRIKSDPITVDAGGFFSTQIYGNDVILPAGTYYTLMVTNDNGDIVQINAYVFTGTGEINLADKPPINPIDPPPPLDNQLVMVPSGPTPNFPGDAGLSFQMTLNQNVTLSTFTNGVEGNLYTFILLQDSVGGWEMTWPTNLDNGCSLILSPFTATTQTFVCVSGGRLLAIAPGMWA
jgi:hypothetical protein